jgi:hypothetical protein
MFDKILIDKLNDNLEKRVVDIANINIYLVSQGYLVNNNKELRFILSCFILHAFNNADILNDAQKEKLIGFYNNIIK